MRFFPQEQGLKTNVSPSSFATAACEGGHAAGAGPRNTASAVVRKSSRRG